MRRFRLPAGPCALGLTALLACSGTAALEGTWDLSIGESLCSGTMVIQQSGTALSGSWTCGARGGPLSGSVSGSSVSLELTDAWRVSATYEGSQQHLTGAADTREPGDGGTVEQGLSFEATRRDALP